MRTTGVRSMRYKIEVYALFGGVYDIARRFYVEATNHDEALREARYQTPGDAWRTISAVPHLEVSNDDLDGLLFDAPGG